MMLMLLAMEADTFQTLTLVLLAVILVFSAVRTALSP